MTKTWVEKRENDKVYQVKVNPKKFSNIPPQTKMLIPTPRILDTLIRQIPKSSFLYFKPIRKELAYKYDAEMTCPIVTGICMRIICEAAFEEYQINKDDRQITSFWRAVEPDSKLAQKLTCGLDFIIQRQSQEGITF